MNFSPKTLLAIGMTPLEIEYLGKSLEMRELILGLQLLFFIFIMHRFIYLFSFFSPFFFFLPGLQFSMSRLWLPGIHLLTEVTLQVLKGAVGCSADPGSGTQGNSLGSSCDLGCDCDSGTAPPVFSSLAYGQEELGVPSAFFHPFSGCSWPRLPPQTM